MKIREDNYVFYPGVVRTYFYKCYSSESHSVIYYTLYKNTMNDNIINSFMFLKMRIIKRSKSTTEIESKIDSFYTTSLEHTDKLYE